MLAQIPASTLLSTRIYPGMEVLAARRVPPPAEAEPNQETATHVEIARHDETARPEEATQPSQSLQMESGDSLKLWNKESFSFWDILDIINPLQHLPIVSTLYRSVGGNSIGAVARVIGGALYGRIGGIASMVSSVVNAVIGVITGKDVGERIYAMLFGGSEVSQGQTVVASQASPARSLPQGPVETGMVTAVPQPATAPDAAPSLASVVEKANGLPAQKMLSYHPFIHGKLVSVVPKGEQTTTATNGNKQFYSPETFQRIHIVPQPWMTRDMSSALGLYGRVAEMGTVRERRIDREW